MWASSWFVNEPLLSQTATQVWLFLGIPTVPRRNDVDYLTTYGPRASLTAMMKKSRIVTLGFGTERQKMALERRTKPKRSRRTCSSMYGLQSCEREIGGRRETAA